MKPISELPPLERAKRYRELAHEARFRAALCSGTIQASFIKMAGQWEQLALEADSEATADGPMGG